MSRSRSLLASAFRGVSRSVVCGVVMVVITATAAEAQVTALASDGNAEHNPDKKEDSWLEQRDNQREIVVRTRELTLYPQAEPVPALRYRLLPDSFDMKPGNAAVHYLKALGFLEQEPARQQRQQYIKEATDRAVKQGKGVGEVPPYVWNSTPPDQLPLEEVKKFLAWTDFQRPMLREGSLRRDFNMDRHYADTPNPIAYLLPEIQSMRDVARLQSMRCRVAIAEGELEQAIEIVGQQFAMARHLGQDDFLVSNLVGIAIAGIAWNDMLYILEQPDAPNLYWALTTMPNPLVDTTHGMAVERQFLYLQLKSLREVDEQPRDPGYWREFMARLPNEIGSLGSELGLGGGDRDKLQQSLTVAAAMAYPGAKQYLIEVLKMDAPKVEAMPVAQVVLLAAVRFHDQMRDDMFKWDSLPPWQGIAVRGANDRQLQAATKQYGLFTAPTATLLPAVNAVRTARARCDQTIALLRAVEAVRMYAANHDGQLPRTLDELDVPAPIEPFTGKPIRYEWLKDRAILEGHVVPGLQYRLVLRIKQNKEK
ncbi:MAG: hypothetical protein KDB14_19600 [Planctomycetales bacterium]|nr:hypothetical protein [Planctomycetales bacterium]